MLSPPNAAAAAQLLSIFLDCTYDVLKCRLKDAGADGGLQLAVGGGDSGTYLPTYLQLFYYSKVRAAEHYCETKRGGLGRCPRASAVRQDTGTPLRPQLPHPRNCSKVALRCVVTIRKLSVFIKKSTRAGATKTPRYPRLNYGWYNTHIPPSG